MGDASDEVELRQALLIDLHQAVERLEAEGPSEFTVRKKELLLTYLSQCRQSFGIEESSESEDLHRKELRELRDAVRAKDRKIAEYRQIIKLCQEDLARVARP